MGKGVEKVRDFMKKEAVLCIALGLAILSVFWQPVDKEYMEYIDWNTLMLLFCLMAAMAGFQRLGIFQKTGDFLLGAVKNTRSLLLILCFLPFFFSMLITNDVALITFVPFGMIVLQMDFLLGAVKNTRSLLLILCFLPFFFSMLITNDVALITFVPFGMIVLQMCKKERFVIPLVVLQTIAANMGSSLTPIGNPQNLYLYSQSGAAVGDFLLWMLPYTLVTGICIGLAVLFQKKEKVEYSPQKSNAVWGKKRKFYFISYVVMFLCCLVSVSKMLPPMALFFLVLAFLVVADRKILYCIDYALLGTFVALFLCCLVSVSKMLPPMALFFLVLAFLVVADRKILYCIDYALLGTFVAFFIFIGNSVSKMLPPMALFFLVLAFLVVADRKILYCIDYALLGTFVAFFIFIGNLGRVPAFRDFFARLLTGHETLAGVVSSQVISNVPAALLLSGFTDKWESLVVGTNLGGLGTLIASMASLISYKQMVRQYPSLKGKYFLYFTLGNVSLVVGTNLGGLGTLIASMASLISYKQMVRQYPSLKGKYFLYFTLGNVGMLLILLGVYAGLKVIK